MLKYLGGIPSPNTFKRWGEQIIICRFKFKQRRHETRITLYDAKFKTQ